MTTIEIRADDATAQQILEALREAEEFGQITEPFNIQTKHVAEITEIEPTHKHTIAPQGWRD